MDANPHHARDLIAAAYARPTLRRREPFHLGWLFDAVVVAVLLIAALGYLTA